MNNVTQNGSGQDFGSRRGRFRTFGRTALFVSAAAFAGLMQGCASTGEAHVSVNEAHVVAAPVSVSVKATPPATASAAARAPRAQTGHAVLASAIVPLPPLPSPASQLARVAREQGDQAALAAISSPAKAFAPSKLASLSVSSGIAPRSYAALPSRTRTADGDAPDIFGSVALAVGQTPSSPSWRRVAAASLPGVAGPWAQVEQQARALPARDQLRLVNAWVNHAITFTDDARLYKTSDYWATASESLRRGQGDCEDFAIAKMQLLRALGVPSDHLYLVIAHDLVRHADHALLAVRLDGRFWILDSAGDTILPAEQVRDYRPIVTYSENHAWMHGYRRAPTVMMADAGAPAALGAAAP